MNAEQEEEHLKRLWENGSKAWADVKSPADWVEEIRGNTLESRLKSVTLERDALAAQLERANEEIEVHKDRIQDLRELVQEYRQCIRPGDLANLREEQS